MLKGGKCEICGYNKNISALEFHHINPDEKELALDARSFSNNKYELLNKEVEKCMLLCSNCHREMHNPTLMLENIPNIINDKKEEQINYRRIFGQKEQKRAFCANCGKEFKYMKGKIFCCEQCKYEYKKYPSIEEIQKQYELLHNWTEVAKYFNLTRKVIQNIRKRFGVLPHRNIKK